MRASVASSMRVAKTPLVVPMSIARVDKRCASTWVNPKWVVMVQDGGLLDVALCYTDGAAGCRQKDCKDLAIATRRESTCASVIVHSPFTKWRCQNMNKVEYVFCLRRPQNMLLW